MSNFFAVPLDKIPFVDNPEIRVDQHESTEMPFRYVTDKNGQPIMPEVGALNCYACHAGKSRSTAYDRSLR